MLRRTTLYLGRSDRYTKIYVDIHILCSFSIFFFHHVETPTFLQVNDEINITGTTYDTREQITEESNVTKGSPETIEEETVKSFLDGEMPLLAADKSRGEDNNEQAIADTYKGTQESNKEEIFVDIEKEDEACKKEVSLTMTIKVLVFLLKYILSLT